MESPIETASAGWGGVGKGADRDPVAQFNQV